MPRTLGTKFFFCASCLGLGICPSSPDMSWPPPVIPLTSDFNSIKDYEIWCAKYSTEKPSISKYEAWQYGSENYTWASTAIDTSYFYKTYNDTNTVVVNTNTTTADIPYVTYGKITAHSLNIWSIPPRFACMAFSCACLYL